MKHGSLFSGIGGFDLAAEWMGWENVFHCEWNEFGQRVLKHYWPQAITHEDIKTTDFTVYRGRIDVLSGGFPCQPYSQAGKRLGTEDDRHLWPEMLRAIREIRPRWVVGENVRGLINWSEGLVFDEVQADLEDEGYEVQPFLLPACAVNAPHRRDRIWFIAKDTNRDGWRGDKREEKSSKRKQRDFVARNNERIPADDEEIGFVADAIDGGHQARRQSKGKADGIPKVSGAELDTGKPDRTDLPRPELQSVTSDTERIGSPGTGHREAKPRQHTKTNPRPGWEDFPNEPPIYNGNDGVPAELDGITFSKWRNQSIKAGGNAIVPQVAYQIFKSIADM